MANCLTKGWLCQVQRVVKSGLNWLDCIDLLYIITVGLGITKDEKKNLTRKLPILEFSAKIQALKNRECTIIFKKPIDLTEKIMDFFRKYQISRT